MTTDIQKISSAELSSEKLKYLISHKESFQVVGVADISKVVESVEGCVETLGMKCRVYTEFRTAALAGEVLVGGIGLIAAAGIALHNLATYDPDYEIGKNMVTGHVTVTYRRVK